MPLRNPYGRLLSSSGPLAGANLYRFSGKEVNPNYPDAGGYYSFGYRFYDPNLQRWVNRDPIGELGGINLYAALANDPFNQLDPYGLSLREKIANTISAVMLGIGLCTADPDEKPQVPRPPIAQRQEQEEKKKKGKVDRAGSTCASGGKGGSGAGRKPPVRPPSVLPPTGAAKACAKAGARFAGPAAVVSVAGDLATIGATAQEAAGACAAGADALESFLDTQQMVNSFILDSDDLSDDDITYYMRRRIGVYR